MRTEALLVFLLVLILAVMAFATALTRPAPSCTVTEETTICLALVGCNGETR